jgi:hypothetical protein
VEWLTAERDKPEEEVITHELKIYPRFFEAVMSGDKTFELRRNDRDYKVGDILLLEEFEDEICGSYTGRNLSVTISYILKEEEGKGWIGLLPGYCCIGFKVVGNNAYQDQEENHVEYVKPRVIAVDFDGCLVENKYPEIGATNEDVFFRLRDEIEAGAKVILWTCRRDELLSAAVKWCDDHHLYLDAVNENLPEVIEYFGSDTRKIFANEYWDDRAVRMPL